MLTLYAHEWIVITFTLCFLFKSHYSKQKVTKHVYSQELTKAKYDSLNLWNRPKTRIPWQVENTTCKKIFQIK